MEIQQPINNQTEFAITFATHLLTNKPNSNVVFSPLSIHVVLSLIAAGSEGETLDQLLAFLKTSTTNELNSLYSRLVPLIFPKDKPSSGPRLAFANGVWVNKTLSLKPSFMQVVDTVYKAGCKHVNFINKKAAAKEMNSWASKQTNGLINEVLPTNAIDKDTMLIFANAIYFKGAWKQKFEASMTKEFDFHLLHGGKVRVPFMTNYEKQLVSEHNDFKVLALPYLGGREQCRFTMYIFLPDANNGLESLLGEISSSYNFFDRHIPCQKVKVHKFLIPKIKITFGFEASDLLKDLGLSLPFDIGDGFREMVYPFPDEGLYVSSIYQKSFVEVNEEGTEAAAVDIRNVQKGCSNQSKKVNFVADHPFLFVIREDKTGVLLFMGQVIDPSQERDQRGVKRGR